MAFTVRGPGGLLLPEESAPATPPSGQGRLWVDTNGVFHLTNDAGADLSIGSGGAAPSLGTNYSNDALGLAVPASRTVAAVNGMYWVPIRVNAGASLTGLRYRRGAGTTAANVIAALYNSAGTKVAESASIAQGTVASAVINCPFAAVYTAPAGLYWAGIIGNAVAASFFGWAVNEFLGPAGYVAQATFAAPATFTPPATSVLTTAAAIPWVTTY